MEGNKDISLEDDFYETLGVSRDATTSQLKRAYRKASLRWHPDRWSQGSSEDIARATANFQCLGIIHQTLCDVESRQVYDSTGAYGNDASGLSRKGFKDWMEYWRNMFPRITEDQIKVYAKEYVGSRRQEEDVFKAYAKAKGDFGVMLERIPFVNAGTEADEAFVRKVVNAGLHDGTLVQQHAETWRVSSTCAKGRRKRSRKARREALEANEARAAIEAREAGAGHGESSLIAMFAANRSKRVHRMDSLLERYARIAAEEGRDNDPEPSEEAFAAARERLEARRRQRRKKRCVEG